MKLNELVDYLTLAGVCSMSLISLSVSAQEGAEDATAQTKSTNDALYGQLPFTDKTDFMNAHKGFIAPLPSELIKGKQGNVVWDPQQYALIKEGEKTPDTVNPSLQRQSRLINIGGLSQVTDGVYQIRNLGLSNMTITRGKEGITVIDPLVSAETAKVEIGLYYKNRGKRPVVAVIYTHSRIGHYGGVHGVIDKADVKSGKVKVYTPASFMEEVVSKNIMADNTMSHRTSYMYGNLLKPDAKDQTGVGLGTTASTGTVTLIEPTNYTTHIGRREVIDGLTYDFVIAPRSEAPPEMLWYVEEKGMIEAAEDVTHTLHNTYSSRNTKIRDPLTWSKYINDVIGRWGGKANIIITRHHWLTWGNENVMKLMKSQRDMYRYINDQTLRMTDQGLTHDEITANFKLPSSLEKSWVSRGYYGSVSHDMRATYVFHLGWFNGNPITLDELPPVDAAKKYVDYMGGAGAIIQRAKTDYAQGNYHWVAQVTNNIVFADPSNKEARNLEADALEQVGYQAESGPWCNFYLTGAQGLRNDVVKDATPNTANPDAVKAMSSEMFLDYLAVHTNGEKAANAQAAFNTDLGVDSGKHKLELEDSVLNHNADTQVSSADASITLNRATLNKIILKEESLKRAKKRGNIQISGNHAKLDKFPGYLDSFDFWFNMVTPQLQRQTMP